LPQRRSITDLWPSFDVHQIIYGVQHRGYELEITKSKPPRQDHSSPPPCCPRDHAHPGESLTETVVFSPSTVGTVTDSWIINADDGTGCGRSRSPVRALRPVVTAGSTTPSRGYWLVGSDGGIFSFGSAQFYGSTGDLACKVPLSHRPHGRSWWILLDASDGVSSALAIPRSTARSLVSVSTRRFGFAS